MPEWYQRLIAERDDLQEKMNKLTAFTASENFKSLDPENQALLMIQFDAMKTYRDVLSRRIVINA